MIPTAAVRHVTSRAARIRRDGGSDPPACCWIRSAVRGGPTRLEAAAAAARDAGDALVDSLTRIAASAAKGILRARVC